MATTEAFDLVVPIDLSVVFRPWGPFPGVAGASDQTGPWNQVGASRRPQLTDGSTAIEILTEAAARLNERFFGETSIR